MISLDLSLTGARSRMPGILQTEASECGLACLAMLSAFYGHHVDLAALRRRFAVSLKGMTLSSLIDVASRMELLTRPLRLELRHMKQLRLPCILHWNFNHFVVLKAVHRDGATILDPAVGERRVRIEELSQAFTGVALEVWPGPTFTPGDVRRRLTLRALTGPVSGLRRALAWVLLLALALEVFALLSPLFMQWVVDHVLVGGDMTLLTTLAIGFGLLVLLQQGTSALRAWMIMHFSTQLTVQWQARVFTHMLRLPVPWFEKRHVGDTISRFRSLDVIRRTLATSFIEAVADGFMSVITLIVIFLYSPMLSLICCAAVALYALCRWISFQPLRSATHEHIVHAARQESHFLETLRGIRSVRLLRREPERRSHWLTMLGEQINAGIRGERLQILCGFINGLVFGLENVVVIWLGAVMVLDADMTAGMLVAFIAYKNQFGSRIAALVDRIVEIRTLGVHTARLADIITEPVEDTQGTEQTPGHAPAGTAHNDIISVSDLRFRYAEHEPWVLDGISFTVQENETLAIVGPSGCGKSTLLALLLGLIRPTHGSVLLAGRPARITTPDNRCSLIGAALQDDLLFAGSVAENISFFDPSADQTRIRRAAEIAAVHDEIVAMPMGYNTFVGHMGSVLSSGQKQRILLARALYGKPRILLLDEATSHLDLEREAHVNRALDAMRITRIIVAHRPESIAAANRVLILNGGRIAQTLHRLAEPGGT